MSAISIEEKSRISQLTWFHNSDQKLCITKECWGLYEMAIS